MIKICKNCNHVCTGNYCSNCGQSTSLERINFHFIIHDFQHGFLHFDKGLFITIKALLLNPGTTIRDFINGKWMKFFHPFSLLIILSMFYGFFYVIEEYNNLNDKFLNTYYSIFNYLINHRNLLNTILIPIFTLITKLIFKNQKYNFYELLVLETYSQSILTVINILFMPISSMSTKYDINNYITFLIITFFFIRTKVLFFKELKIAKAIIYSIISLTLNFIALLAFLIILTTITYYFNFIFHNE